MYKGTSWLVALLVMASSVMLVRAQSTSTADLPFTETAPVIDGVKDDAYPDDGDAAGVFPMLHPRGDYLATGVEPEDLSGTAYAMWDADFLYVIAVVVDDLLMADTPTSTWQDDSIELYLDGGFEQCLDCYDENDTQYRFRPGYEPEGIPQIYTAGRGNNSAPAPTEEFVEWTNTLTDDPPGYIIEIALPWELNPVFDVEIGKQIGFDVHINDDDQSGATREGKLHWSDAEGDNQWQHADNFGTVTLVGAGGGGGGEIGTPENPLLLMAAPGEPELDGVREALWDGATEVKLEKVSNGSPPNDEADFSTTAWVMWSPESLYLFYEVQDEFLNNDSNSGWQDDRPEVYVDLGHELTVGDLDENDAYWEFEWNNNVITGGGEWEGAESSEYVSVDTDAGYNIEAKVTWGELGFPIAAGQLIGFELMNNDADTPGDVRNTKLAWFSEEDEAWQDSGQLGTAQLVGGTAAEDPSEMPGGFSIASIYPNPFNPSTTALLSIDQPGTYTIRVFNVLGQAVYGQTLAVQTVGEVSVPFDLRDEASGMYLFSVENQSTGQVMTSKAMLLK